MKSSRWFAYAGAAAALAAVLLAQAVDKKNRTSPVGYEDTPVLPGQPWRVHDIKRPHPAQVTPGARCGEAPSDAVVLFDGKDLSRWQTPGQGASRGKMAAPRWKVEHGYVEVAGGTGDLVSKEKFGDCQLHIEWAAPPAQGGSSQGRGNSGVLLMSRYEDPGAGFLATTPPTRTARRAPSTGSIPPLVSPVRPPGEWNTYDIAFEAPRFEGGKLAGRRMSRCFTTACWCTATARSSAPWLTAPGAPTRRTPPKSRWRCRTTTRPCATAISGCGG